MSHVTTGLLRPYSITTRSFLLHYLEARAGIGRYSPQSLVKSSHSAELFKRNPPLLAPTGTYSIGARFGAHPLAGGFAGFVRPWNSRHQSRQCGIGPEVSERFSHRRVRRFRLISAYPPVPDALGSTRGFRGGDRTDDDAVRPNFCPNHTPPPFHQRVPPSWTAEAAATTARREFRDAERSPGCSR